MVECRQKVSANVVTVLTDDQCSGTKPATSEKCNQKDCEPEWVPSDWSAVGECYTTIKFDFLQY